jgi:osmotically-inducible protein OsmY
MEEAKMMTKTVLAVAAALACAAFAGAASAHSMDTPQQVVADAQITQQVASQIDRDFPNWAARIQVSTQAGVVTLSGYAETTYGERKILEDAQGVPGVVRVRNDLQVVS